MLEQCVFISVVIFKAAMMARVHREVEWMKGFGVVRRFSQMGQANIYVSKSNLALLG